MCVTVLTQTNMRAYIHMCVLTYTSTLHYVTVHCKAQHSITTHNIVYVDISTYKCVCICVCIYIYIHISTVMRMCIYIYICMHIKCVGIYIYMHMSYFL